MRDTYEQTFISSVLFWLEEQLQSDLREGDERLGVADDLDVGPTCLQSPSGEVPLQ